MSSRSGSGSSNSSGGGRSRPWLNAEDNDLMPSRTSTSARRERASVQPDEVPPRPRRAARDVETSGRDPLKRSSSPTNYSRAMTHGATGIRLDLLHSSSSGGGSRTTSTTSPVASRPTLSSTEARELRSRRLRSEQQLQSSPSSSSRRQVATNRASTTQTIRSTSPAPSTTRRRYSNERRSASTDRMRSEPDTLNTISSSTIRRRLGGTDFFSRQASQGDVLPPQVPRPPTVTRVSTDAAVAPPEVEMNEAEPWELPDGRQPRRPLRHSTSDPDRVPSVLTTKTEPFRASVSPPRGRISPRRIRTGIVAHRRVRGGLSADASETPRRKSAEDAANVMPPPPTDAMRRQSSSAYERSSAALETTRPSTLTASRPRKTRDKPRRVPARRRRNSEPDDFLDSSCDDMSEVEDTLSPMSIGKPITSSFPTSFAVRVCVVSAVDLPQNIVPNMPVCPVLRFGLVPIADMGIPSYQLEEDDIKNEILKQLTKKHSVAHLKGARVRCTSDKILGRRDNGSVEFHEDLRWDQIDAPRQTALVVELCARAVLPPTNLECSPKVTTSPASPSSSPNSGNSPYWNRTTSSRGEWDQANAAAAVARYLAEGTVAGGEAPSRASAVRPLAGTLHSDTNVALLPCDREFELTEDIRVGTLVIPLTRLPLEKAQTQNEVVRVEQWYQLEQGSSGASQLRKSPSSATRRQPSVLLEISFAAPQLLDDSEDEMEDDSDTERDVGSLPVPSRTSFSKRASIAARSQVRRRRAIRVEEDSENENPALDAGIVDFIAVVGARDIGNQQNDDGSRGWVNSTPECCVLEQFPKSDDFHVENGRMVALPGKVEWFCFPEGCKLWRGTEPPTHQDLNLTRFSASSPPNVAMSVAAFDACLNCTTSFSWFVIASNSDAHGFKTVKTYGAVIRFYVPAPKGIDQKQDDFAQPVTDSPSPQKQGTASKRLWVPVGICLTSNLPIVGVLEGMLLRLCEKLSLSDLGPGESLPEGCLESLYRELGALIVNYPKPSPGMLNCSVPFLSEPDLFHITLPPPTGLPPIPHGTAVVSTCRLLGAEGINFMLAAVLTESKILLHSKDVANAAMVAEVITALIYPFQWASAFIPVLPADMMEFVEAPVPFILGVPSCNAKLLDPNALEDVVVVDLDNGFSSPDYFDARRAKKGTKVPTPLPSSVAKAISKSVFRLMREDEDLEDEFIFSKPSHRLEAESLAEREFRISVALQICGLVRGYQECIAFVTASQPVFNRDKFLKIAPALYEDRRVATDVTPSLGTQSNFSQRVLSPRSKRFLSIFINCQHFQQFLEALETDELAFFHQVMETYESGNEQQALDPVAILRDTLQKKEDKIPNYRIPNLAQKKTAKSTMSTRPSMFSSFTRNLLQPIVPASASSQGESAERKGQGHHSLSLEYLLELEKNPWRYRDLFAIPDECAKIADKTHLREAIGDRKFRAWKFDTDTTGHTDGSTKVLPEGTDALDLTTLLSSASADARSDTASTASTVSSTDVSSVQAPTPSSVQSPSTPSLTPEQQRVADAKDRDALRRCLERAYEKQHRGTRSSSYDQFIENGRDLVSEAEVALRNPSAQRFLLTVLSQRSRLENQRRSSRSRRMSIHPSVSRLEPSAFECLVRLCCAMLDACTESKDYVPAYTLLTHTAGFCTLQSKDDPVHLSKDGDEQEGESTVIYMTARIGLHPIFADVALWEIVMDGHAKDRQQDKGSSDGQAADGSSADIAQYEAAVATLYEMLGYGVPSEELARFASRVCESRGWFSTERGNSLLSLARRLSVRREQDEDATQTADLDMVRRSSRAYDQKASNSDKSGIDSSLAGEETMVWSEIGWCHPAATSLRRMPSSGSGEAELSGLTKARNITQGLLGRPEDPKPAQTELLKRSAVTSLATFGPSLVVTGGLDGSVFLAHTINTEENNVRGIHLDWGSSGSQAVAGSASTAMDGEYGVGAVSCLVAAKGARNANKTDSPGKKDVVDSMGDDELLASMEGSRVIAGTTGGDLRVWSVKDVYSAAILSRKTESADGSSSSIGDSRTHHGSDGPSSSLVTGSSLLRTSIKDIPAGSALTRLKFSLRGRALSGHRGGVTCIDVPSLVYRPDSLVTGGADGLIKLWSLRAPTGLRSAINADPRSRGTRGGDALSILSGHAGRIVCVQTAWHGDRLLSGGADRSIRIWDLAGSGGKCLHSLSGHLGWVTQAQYWGPNTVVSASTDRSIALWDARVKSSPLFVLRHHQAPISSLLVGMRTDPLMVSAANDGTIATWDFRTLSGDVGKADVTNESLDESGRGSVSGMSYTSLKRSDRHLRVVRHPAATMDIGVAGRGAKLAGPVLLSAGLNKAKKTVLSVGSDAVLREWETGTGRLLGEHTTGHCDVPSSLGSFGQTCMASHAQSTDIPSTSGTITASWDGTVRMRILREKS